ncbi:MAG: mevalonate kinase [Candidatus Syntrophoarchaeum caldarius]|uniref:Mevalonate kinase n=1 Tax=Candidatus Syntropharchaeum caldarium TaxID=1838285 RepID=A0A1F2P8W8_9EURY|nr:MAG: mevalonate kinase [Candidatus Syntrophoarchaeum caldarius]
MRGVVVYSAPAKVYLSGEHAVVYNKRAVAVGIDLRTTVRLERSDNFHYQTNADTRYLEEAVNAFSSIKAVDGVEIKVESEIPVGAGLGSSAAVTVATLGALNEEFDANLSKEDIAKLAFEVERSIQGVASPTDTFVSTMGGCVLVPDLLRIQDTLDCAIVIGDTRTVGSTKKLVQAVKELRSSEPEVIDLIFDAIDRITAAVIEWLEAADYKRLGMLMNINHGLLDAIGVGSLELSALVDGARSHGAYGAKITGAGGGGCIVAICEAKKVAQVVEGIEEAGGKAIVADVSGDGLRKVVG